ncbi:MAG: hypothetical protein H6943_01995 [Zoogloeaceae bacterium]|nr:hypothetical protein [Zoogloeaceae bacterium]
MQEFEKTVSGLMKKLDQLLADTDGLVKRLEGETVPEFSKTLLDARNAMKSAERIMADESPLQTDLREALRELSRTAASLKVLTDYVERQPQSLIFGKPAEEPQQ